MSLQAIQTQPVYIKPIISKAIKYSLLVTVLSIAFVELDSHLFAVLGVFSAMLILIFQRARAIDAMNVSPSLPLTREKFYDGGTFNFEKMSDEKSTTKNIVYDGGTF